MRTRRSQQVLLYFGFRRRAIDARVAADPQANRYAEMAQTFSEGGFSFASLSVVIDWILPHRSGWIVVAASLLGLAVVSWVSGFALTVISERIAGSERGAGAVFRASYLTETAAALVLLGVAVALLVGGG